MKVISTNKINVRNKAPWEVFQIQIYKFSARERVHLDPSHIEWKGSGGRGIH